MEKEQAEALRAIIRDEIGSEVDVEIKQDGEGWAVQVSGKEMKRLWRLVACTRTARESRAQRVASQQQRGLLHTSLL